MAINLLIHDFFIHKKTDKTLKRKARQYDDAVNIKEKMLIKEGKTIIVADKRYFRMFDFISKISIIKQEATDTKEILIIPYIHGIEKSGKINEQRLRPHLPELVVPPFKNNEYTSS